MPPQKNSGNKKARRETGVAQKNRKFIADMIYDYKTEGKIDGVYIGRVTGKLGNGLVKVFYVAKELEKAFDKNGEEVWKDVYNSYEEQASIKGSFTGKGKHSVWIDVGSAVAIAEGDTDLKTKLQIVAVITRDQLKDIAKVIHVDERVMSGVKDGEICEEDAIEFDNNAGEEESSTVDIDDI